MKAKTGHLASGETLMHEQSEKTRKNALAGFYKTESLKKFPKINSVGWNNDTKKQKR